jgi:polyisoprenoid-binding protein YceI
MKKNTLWIITLAYFLAAQPAAMAYEWQLDKGHSGIMFEVKHIYSTIRGNFDDFSGVVIFDPSQPEKSRADFSVKVDSIYTGIAKRDNHLRSDDFFASGTYPEMTFKSTRVTHVEGNRYAFEGQMTVKDVTRDMALQFIYLGQTESPFKKDQMVAGFETRFSIDRLEFNVGKGKFYEMGVVGKDVDVLISLEMTRKK